MAGTEKAKWEILLSKLSKKGLPNPTGRLKQAHSISPPTEFPDNFIFSNNSFVLFSKSFSINGKELSFKFSNFFKSISLKSKKLLSFISKILFIWENILIPLSSKISIAIAPAKS